MSAYLAYSYSTRLGKEEETQIDQHVKENQINFKEGFKKGTVTALALYSVYSMTTHAAHALEPIKSPGPGQVEPAPATAPADKPGFKPLGDAPKGAFIVGASAICGAALQSGDFYLGFACAMMLVVGGIVINRPPAK